MSPRTQTRPLDDARMWRLLIAATHPDTERGSHELFIWTGTVKDAVCGGELRVESKPQPSDKPSRRREPSTPDDKPRVPYPDGTDFEEVTRRARQIEGGPYAHVLSLLIGIQPLEHLAHEHDRSCLTDERRQQILVSLQGGR